MEKRKAEKQQPIRTLRPGSHLDGKAEANQNSRKDKSRQAKCNVNPA